MTLPSNESPTRKLSRRDAMRRLATATASLGIASLAAQQTSAAEGVTLDPSLEATQWWSWRGPTANNHAPKGSTVPDAITPEAAVWSVDVPGRGHSSPIVAGDAIYLTTHDRKDKTQSVLAFNREDGSLLWSVVAHTGGIPTGNHPKNTEASPSVACDGEAVYASFYNDDAIRVTKISLAGVIDWQVSAGRYRPTQYEYGYAASPQIYGDTVLVAADFDGASYITALSRNDGREVWKTPRSQAISFSSPIVAEVAGREQLLLSGGNRVAGYDPSTGKRLWQNPGATTMATCGTMVWTDNLVFASGGYPKPQTVCIDASGGEGEIVWSNREKCYEQSMLIVGDSLYGVTDAGIAFCLDTATGKTQWKERLGGKYSSSPILVGSKIHVFNESGQGFCYEASPDAYREQSRHTIGDEMFATPSVVDSTMYLRTAVSQRGRRQERLLAVR